MARIIKLNQIDDIMKECVEDLVEATTLKWTREVKKETPVDTGRLRAAWQTDIKPLQGTITNNLPYAEPVCYGTNLPKSWGGIYRTRQGTVAGFPELIGKGLPNYISKEYARLLRSKFK